MNNKIRCIAFDCFGTIFDMSSVPKEEIKAYVSHVRDKKFKPFRFPESWWSLNSFSDVKEGIRLLQSNGFFCVTLSNGSKDLIYHISAKSGIEWDHITDLEKHKVYKPKIEAYYSILNDLAIPTNQTLMVTANKGSGDLKLASEIGMSYQLIRNGYPNTIIDLADLLSQKLSSLSPAYLM